MSDRLVVDSTHADLAVRAALAKAAAGELLGPADIQAIWRIKHSRYQQLVHAGAFEQFKVKPPIGKHCYSGVLVHRYLHGDALYEPSFGRKKRA